MSTLLQALNGAMKTANMTRSAVRAQSRAQGPNMNSTVLQALNGAMKTAEMTSVLARLVQNMSIMTSVREQMMRQLVQGTGIYALYAETIESLGTAVRDLDRPTEAQTQISGGCRAWLLNAGWREARGELVGDGPVVAGQAGRRGVDLF